MADISSDVERRENRLWQAQVSMLRIRQKASRGRQTCPGHASSGEAGIAIGDVAPSAGRKLVVTDMPSASCTTWAMPVAAAPWRFMSTIPNIGVARVGGASTPTWTTWPCPSAITPIASNRERCVWSWRTACPIVWPVGTCGETTGSSCPSPQFRTGSRGRGKKGTHGIEGQYLEEALKTFSGYLAADEVYDGPFCILSIVDNRTFQRLAYRVLEEDPTQEDIREFFGSFRARLEARGLKVLGITTDGSPLYPVVIRDVFPEARHQVCQFHVLKEITKAVLHAVAKVRKELKARQPALPRGRPSKAQQARARKAKRIQQRIADLFDHRHLFVRRHLTPAQRRKLQRITRGLAHLRTLRQIMDEVYRLFDRRCSSETALSKLARLRRRVRRFKRVGRTLSRLFTPNLEKALAFLDDRLLPATSNAVERGNRRFRKAQRSVYSVRTAQHIRQRIALDMQRDQQAPRRSATIQTLHHARTQPGWPHQ